MLKAYQVNRGVDRYGGSIGLCGVKIMEDFGLLRSPKIQANNLCSPRGQV